MEDELLTVFEAAEELRKHPQTVRKMLRDGRLEGHRVGKAIRVKRSELTAAIQPYSPGTWSQPR